MRRRALLALLAALLAGPAAAAGAARLTVMTFNVRVPIDTAPARTWAARLPVAAAAIRRADPDVIGTQELRREQGDDLVAALPAFRCFGIDRRGGHQDEHMGVFYRADRLRLVVHGDFWLSGTPNVPGSITWGNLYPRMVTWGLFERRADRRRFTLFNTHFPYRPEDGPARAKAADAIAARIAALPARMAVVLTGDFNTDAGDPVHARLAALLPDARDAAPASTGPAATFHAFTGAPDRRLDWILARGLVARSSATLTHHAAAVWPSDHFPVVARFAWPLLPARNARQQ